jgi:hypothetical protein
VERFSKHVPAFEERFLALNALVDDRDFCEELRLILRDVNSAIDQVRSQGVNTMDYGYADDNALYRRL